MRLCPVICPRVGQLLAEAATVDLPGYNITLAVGWFNMYDVLCENSLNSATCMVQGSMQVCGAETRVTGRLAEASSGPECLCSRAAKLPAPWEHNFLCCCLPTPLPITGLSRAALAGGCREVRRPRRQMHG